MRKTKDNSKVIKKILRNPLLNNAEMQRILGVSSGSFSDKLNEKNGARFTEAQKKIITRELKKFSKKLSNALYPSKKM